MGIKEDMEMLQFLQQSAGQQNPQAMQQQPDESQMEIPSQNMQRNPLQAGSREAIEASKRSLEMNENENRRALGRALMGMMSGIGQSQSYGHGLAGNLGAINAGFMPALNAYDAERDRIMQMNHAIQMQHKAEEIQARKEEREMKKMQHEMDLANKRLQVEQGYFGLEKEKREDERREHEQLSHAGAKIPLSHLKPSQWNIAQKEIQSNMEKGQAAHDTLQSIYGAKNILKNDENENITKNMATIMLAAQRNDPNIIRQKLNSWLIPEKTRVNAEMLAKNLSNIYTSKLKGFPARGMNMFLEKQLREGNVDIHMSSDSIIKLLEKDEKALEHIYKGAQEVYDEYEKGYFYRPRPMKIETEMIEENEPSSKNEQILKEISRLEEMMKTAPE